MRAPNTTDREERNGFLSLLSLVFGLSLILIASMLCTAKILVPFMVLGFIVGGIFTLIGIVWTIFASIENDYSIQFLFDEEEEAEQSKT